MTDIKSPEARSQNMAKIRSKDTKPEIWLRKKLFAKGYRYRKNVNYIVGHPDLWLKKYNTAIFVHGCFWHRHAGCKYAYTPKTRMDFWLNKFEKNKERDLTVQKQLKTESKKCLIIWECTVKRMKKDKNIERQILDDIASFLNSETEYIEF